MYGGKTDPNFDATAGRFTAPVDGFYHFSAEYGGLPANVRILLRVNYNGAWTELLDHHTGANCEACAQIHTSFDLYLTAGQYVELGPHSSYDYGSIIWSGFLVG